MSEDQATCRRCGRQVHVSFMGQIEPCSCRYPMPPLDDVEVRALLERLEQEPIMDGGDGPFVELWEADFRALMRLASPVRKEGEVQ